MSGPLQAIRGVLAIVDFLKGVNEAPNCFKTNATELDKASAVNRCVLSLCILSEHAMLAYGSKSKDILPVKGVEVITRLVDVFVQPAKAAQSDEDTFAKEVQFFGSTVSAVANLVRAAAEAGIYNENSLLELPDEEFKNAKRLKPDGKGCSGPIYLFNSPVGGSVYYPPCPNAWKEVPADREECKRNRAFFQETADLSAVTRAVSDLFTAYSKDLYTRLQQVVAQRNQDNILINLPYIPTPLRGDAVLRQHICPLTRLPIRYVVCDPDGVTHYERSAILARLQESPVSPATGLPLEPHDLLEEAVVQAQIDQRLRAHQTAMNAFLQQNGIN